MAPAQGLFDNCIYRHGGFLLSATSSCPAISQMSSTLSSPPAKHSRWKNGNTPTGNRFGQNYAKQAVHSHTALLPWYVYFSCSTHFVWLPIFINFSGRRRRREHYTNVSDHERAVRALLCRPVSHSFLLFIREARVSSLYPQCVSLFLHTFSGSNNSPLIAGPS